MLIDIMNSPLQRVSPQRGMTLVELMIALTLGLIILMFLTTLYVTTNNARKEVDKASRQIENGSYAMQLMNDDIQLAGYLGSYTPSVSAPVLAAVPDPCAASSLTLSAVDGARALHVQGYDNVATALTCLTDMKTGTDVIVVRRASTCAVGESGCDGFLSGAPHIQASGCTTDAQSYLIDTVASNLTLKKIDCTAAADVRRYLVHIYYVANNNIGSDGVPTLKRAELSTSSGAMAWNIVPLVEGIENVQFEYGIDSNTAQACSTTSPPYTQPCDDGSPSDYSLPASVQDWWNVVAVKVSILARNTEPTTGYTDTKSYTLGNQTIAAQNDHYKRHVFSATVRLANPAGRRE